MLGSPVQQFPLHRTNTNSFEELWRSPGAAAFFSPGLGADLLGLGLAGLGSLQASPLARSLMADPLFSHTPKVGNTPQRATGTGLAQATGAAGPSPGQDFFSMLGMALGTSGLPAGAEETAAGAVAGSGASAHAHAAASGMLPGSLGLLGGSESGMVGPGPDTARALAECAYLNAFGADGLGRDELLRALLSPDSKVRAACMQMGLRGMGDEAAAACARQGMDMGLG